MPQNYSLAVFGEISGQLESENNPVRLSTGQQSETCVVVSPEIIIKPEVLQALPCLFANHFH